MTSKIKVDNIENQCGGAVVTKCGGTTTISGTTVTATNVKSNALQASDGGNLVSQCGTNITLGASGDTINLAAGASQSGFGRTGTVDWDTTPKTATFSAVSGNGYFVNTTAGVITVNLPAGSAGAIVSLADYAATWQTNNVTVTPNGTDKIGSQNENATLATEGQSVTFVYVDSTQGWINTMDSTSNVRGISPFLVASGGTETTCGNFKIHTFTGPGTFTVNSVSTTAAENTVGYMVIAGGGGGAGSGDSYGGGGAGGFREGRNVPIDNFTASPLVANAPTNAVTVSVQAYPITVGSGGGTNASGSNSTFSSITSTGGGEGGNGSPGPGFPGGSGGGGGSQGCTGYPGGNGNSPPVSPSQGNNGGSGRGNNSPLGGIRFGGGGGGAGAVGGSSGPNTQGSGGAGVSTSISASPLSYAGGAGAGKHASGSDATSFPNGSPCGTGGSGASPGTPTPARNGTINRGGGAGGSGSDGGCGGSGGSGVVVIRYKFQ